MCSVESGRPGVKLQSAPDPTKGESSDDICYCPECGARLRVVGYDSVDKGDRATLPDWLPAVSTVPVPLPVAPGVKPLASAAVKANDPPAPILGLPEFHTLPVDLESAEDDEPTRVVRSSVDLPAAPVTHVVEGADQQVGIVSPRKPPVPVRRRKASDEEDVTLTVRRPVPVYPEPRQPVVAGAGTTPEGLGPSSAPAVVSSANASHAPAEVGSTRNRDVDGMRASDPLAGPVSSQVFSDAPLTREWKSEPRRKSILRHAGLGLGVVMLGGLAFVVHRQSLSTNLEGRGAPAGTTINPTVTRILSAQAVPSAVVLTAPSAEPTASGHASLEPTPSEPKKADAKAAKSSMLARLTQTTAKVDASPVAEEPQDEQESTEDVFDPEEAASALDSAAGRASSCRQASDPSGVAVVTVTFAPSGRVTTATISGPPFVGTATGSCIAATMRSAKVPAFSGKFVTAKKTVTVH